jgi:thiosulfate sulfurtransferase
VASINECSAVDAKEWLKEKSAIFADIRDPQSFEQGHIPGARHLTNEKAEAFLAETPKSSRVVICCYHGNSSKGACQFLQSQGFENSFSLAGGFEAW